MRNKTSTGTASREDATLAALGRSVVYAHLAVGFAYPGERLIALAAESRTLPGGNIGGSLLRALTSFASAGLAKVERSYMRVFDPRRPPFPFEADCRAEQFPQAAFLFADLMGFYRAFGAAPRRERPDHIACELDFLNLLSFKEARALRRNSTEEAEITAEARSVFLRDHLLCWYEDIIRLVQSRATEPQDRCYLEMAEALDKTMQEEKGFPE